MTPEAAVAAPKALLHDHLDGGLRVATILELADEIGWALPTTDLAALQAWFTAGATSGDLLQYLATFDHTLAAMQTPVHVERVAYEAVVDLAADGVIYYESRLAPEQHTAMALQETVEAVTAGFRRGEADAAAAGHVISTHLICCAMRTADRALEIATLVDRMRTVDPKVVGFDLAGAETGFPPSRHAAALAYARERHLNVTIHASEPPDLELIDDALVHGAHRIGHGVRLARDTAPDADAPGGLRLGPLAQHVLDRQVHLELAPTCNVQIGAVGSLAEHPIGPFLRAGFAVGVNTDNRLMSDVTPSSELAAITAAFDLTGVEVERLTTNALAAGFAPHDDRHRILTAVVRPWFAARTEHSDDNEAR
jgi:adenosine deaminase